MIEVWRWGLCSDARTENQSTEKLSTHRAIIGTSGYASENISISFLFIVVTSKKETQNKAEIALFVRNPKKNGPKTS